MSLFSTRAGALNLPQSQTYQRKRQCQHSIRLGATVCATHKPVQPAAQYRVQPSVPIHCAALAYLRLFTNKAAIYPVCVDSVALRILTSGTLDIAEYPIYLECMGYATDTRRKPKMRNLFGARLWMVSRLVNAARSCARSDVETVSIMTLSQYPLGATRRG